MSVNIQFHKDRRDENGQPLVVPNGHLTERKIISGIGPAKVRQPRIRHRDGRRFSCAILPPVYAPDTWRRRIDSGAVSQSRESRPEIFSEALEAILGEKASGLPATNVVRFEAGLEEDYKLWRRRDLSPKRRVYR